MSTPKIMIVEDEGIVAADLKKRLEGFGYSVTGIANSGEEAVEKTETNPPDLVLMDIMLQGEMDGVAVADTINTRSHIPVIFLTAYDDPQILERAKRTGPFGYLLKPIDERVLHTTIEMALSKSQAEKDLRQAKEEAEAATELKDKFVSLVAHDLKSPFTTILGFMKLIMQDSEPSLHPKHREMFQRIHSQGEWMVKLIQEVLDISRLKTGKIKPRFHFLDGHFSAGSVLVNLKPEAEKKNIRLQSEVQRGTRLYGDSDLLLQVLCNLVANAIKFCEPGGEVTLFSPPGEPSTLAVKDTGVGIPENRLASLFRYEERTSTRGTAGEKGTGLGLPLSSDIIKAHGGALDVESSPGQGSVFYVRLPLVRPRVLIVDDDPDTRLMLKKFLVTLNIKILEAENGQDALSLLVKEGPHLVITDINMPVMDGLALLDNIRNKISMKDLPVIVLTADNEEKTRNEVFRMGGNDFVNKPIAKTDFISRVRRFVV